MPNCGHVVICGYGRVGQSIGRSMRREQQAFIALMMTRTVQGSRHRDSSVHYGDRRRGVFAQRRRPGAGAVVTAVDTAMSPWWCLGEARQIDPRRADPGWRTRDDSQ